MVRRGQVTRMHELSGDGLSWMKADEFGNFFPQTSTMTMSSDLAAAASDVPPGEGGMGMGGGEPTKPVVNENAQAQWYAHVNGEKQGPVSMDQMRLYFEANILKKDSMVWRNGMDAWKPAGEVIPEFFGASSGGGPVVVSSSSEPSPAGDAGPFIGEFAKQNVMVLLLGISLLLGGAVFCGAQMMKFSSSSGKKLQSDYLGGTMRISLGGVAIIAGALALQASGRLKAAAEDGSLPASIVAAKAVNQFFVVTGIGLMLWLCVLAIVVVSAIATDVPVLNVLL